MSLIKLENVNKTYGSGALAVHALKDVNLEIEEGYFYAIVGKSGSGKSTMLHILGALDRPSSGKMYLEGESVYDKSDKEIALIRRRRIGFIFQSFNLLSEHSVLENILMPSHLDNKEPDRERLMEIVTSLGLEDKLSYFPDELSGGQMQRVAIARALLTNPAILLADEPTGNLDENTGKEVMELMKESAKKFNQTLVVVTHDMDIAAQADKVINIVDGRIV
ncbi:MAG: ABC transporter ATP-binding protein [Clostridiales bacterium]|nr:ABC transporter ATP-binding protein [Clostridiales bacterium]